MSTHIFENPHAGRTAAPPALLAAALALALLACAVLSLAPAAPARASTVAPEGMAGTAPVQPGDGWRSDGGKTYYYRYGEPLTGITVIQGEYYYFNDEGVMQTGLKRIGDRTYFFKKNGVMKRDAFQTVKGKKRYFGYDGAMARSGYHKGYLVDYKGICHKAKLKKTGDKQADALRVAKQIAACCGPKGVQTDAAYVKRAAGYVASFCALARQTTSGKNHASAYGVFIAREYSSAGSTRALGLVLDCLGYRWTHVNAGKQLHQWCRLKLDGKTGYADAAYLPSGAVGYGAASPLAA